MKIFQAQFIQWNFSSVISVMKFLKVQYLQENIPLSGFYF